MSDDTIGFIGTGRMGVPMAGHLLTAGCRLLVHDLRQESAGSLLARGARWASTPRAVAEGARTVITIVPSSREVEALVAAMQPALGPGHLLIDMTSADPSSTRRLAQEVQARGARLIDAPVSGGVRGAEQATLSIMVGGDAADLERARPLLERMGRRIFHVGGVSTGHAMKLVNNVTSAACLTASAEAIIVAVRAGIDPARAVEIIAASSGKSDAVERKFPQFILPGTYDSGFAMALMAKDVTAFLRLAEEVGYEPQVTAAAAACFRRALEGRLAAGDHTEIAVALGYPDGRS